MTGTKHDSGKARYDLLPWHALHDVVRVITFGAEKYGTTNWQSVEGGRDRFFAAALRHMAAFGRGERLDEETGLPHLAHAACSILFVMWHDAKETARLSSSTSSTNPASEPTSERDAGITRSELA